MPSCSNSRLYKMLDSFKKFNAGKAMMCKIKRNFAGEKEQDIMEEVTVYHSIWRKELFVGIGCLAVTALIPFVGTFTPGDGGVMLVLGMMSLYILFTVFRERLLHWPYLTITDEGIVMRREHYPENVIRFDEVKSFERETSRFLGHTSYTGTIIVHLKNGHGFVGVIGASGLTMKPQQLYDLLNERLKKKKQRRKRGDYENEDNEDSCHSTRRAGIVDIVPDGKDGAGAGSCRA